MENKKPKEFKIPTVPESVNGISPNVDAIQKDYRYGKNQEKLKASQVE